MKKKLALITTAMLPAAAFAQDAAAATAGTNEAPFWAAALTIGLASSVVGFSQSRAASAAMESIGRNPESAGKLFVPLLLSLALMEALVLFAFLVANNILGKV